MIHVQDKATADLVEAVNVKKPTTAALTAYRDWLAATPDGWKLAGDMGQHAEAALLASIQGTPAIVDAVQAGMVAQRLELGYATASALERLLIDQIVLCGVQLAQTERTYINIMKESVTLTVGDYWERRLTTMQGRYLKAIEALARVRRLALPVQINIAAAGGQQVNVVKKT